MTGIQCFWYLVQCCGQFIYNRYKGTLLFKKIHLHRLYKSAIRYEIIRSNDKPMLCYASEIWSACDLSKRIFGTGDGFAEH